MVKLHLCTFIQKKLVLNVNEIPCEKCSTIATLELVRMRLKWSNFF